MGFMAGRYDSRMERNVSMAARNLGDGVQKIVMAAKGKQGTTGEWKAELLKLLGADNDKSEIDALLENSTCEKFVLRCIENELPPNLIHCLRLLRVMELQHANEAHERGEKDPQPIGESATIKVSKLLCKLCKDSSVGEQLRPHLFGLLALSGASYPQSGIHVAKASSDVIVAFSESCLSKSLVQFLHERNMVMHMTDDIKELTGMTKSNGQQAPLSLYGKDAEEAGLWAIALKTVVHMVVNSCNHDCLDMLKDFQAAGGYDVFRFTVLNGTSKHGKELIALIPLLTCCSTDLQHDSSVGSSSGSSSKLATNQQAFEVVEDLMLKYNPLVKAYHDEYHGQKPDFSKEGAMQDLVAFSLKTAANVRFKNGAKTEEARAQYDIESELLDCTLQLYSSHPNNYDILERKYNVLSLFLIAYPTFDDEGFKVFVLKTLEFVLTGVANTDAVRPLHATVEVFFVLCTALLTGGRGINGEGGLEKKQLDAFFEDAEMVGGTMEKLLQFDHRVAPMFVELGIHTTNVDAILNLIIAISKEGDFGTTFERDGVVFRVPPTSTPIDRTVSAVCRILKLLISQVPVRFGDPDDDGREKNETTKLHSLMRRAIQSLGDEAAKATAGVFEAQLTQFSDPQVLENDMDFVLDILDYFTRLSGSRSIEALELSTDPTRADVSITIYRECVVLSMLRSVLDIRTSARDTFRECGGFNCMTRIVLSLKGVAASAEKGGSDEGFASLIKLLQTILGVVDAANGSKSRGSRSTETTAVLVDPVSSQRALATPAATNRFFLRRRGFYLDLAASLVVTGALETPEKAQGLFDVALGHIDPQLKMKNDVNDEDKITNKAHEIGMIRNPDAIRLVLSLAMLMPSSGHGKDISSKVLDYLLGMCSEENTGSSLTQFAASGLCWSLTNPMEFAPLFDDGSHPLHLKFVSLLRRIAAFSMSHSDFVSLLRSVAGPILMDESVGRIRLPVISSSVARAAPQLALLSTSSEAFKEQDDEFCKRLKSMCVIAEKGDRAPLCRVGGDSINTIAVLLHQTKLEERLYVSAQEGRLKFMEIESIDGSALSAEGMTSAGTVAPLSGSGSERVWTPLANSGFSYSAWLRHGAIDKDNAVGNLYVLDMSSPPSAQTDGQSLVFLSVWYDLQNMTFNVVTSAANRSEPICFPVSPLTPDVWHHILLTFTPPKRQGMMSRKAMLNLFVDGRPLETDVKVDSVNLPPNSKVVIGAPNPTLATSGLVRGPIPPWEVGSVLMLSTILLDLDATAIFTFGPDFPGLFWGDRPQRLSLAATGTTTFSMLAENGERGSVASALRRRDLSRLEVAGLIARKGVDAQRVEDRDSLASLGLLCTLPPECIVFGFRSSTISYKVQSDSQAGRNDYAPDRLVNLARINATNETASTDAVVHGRASVIAPNCFADNLQWVGGPSVLLPIVNATRSVRSIALSLRLVRASTHRHTPNLQMMQAGGGYRMLAVLLKEKRVVDERILDQCMAFAVHGFYSYPSKVERENDDDEQFTAVVSDSSKWVFSDLDAMKYLLLNHQVWDARFAGPQIPIRLLSFLNRLVGHAAVHKAFNARRLHLLGIVRWALHLMLDAAELYAFGHHVKLASSDDTTVNRTAAGSKWYCEAPAVDDVAVGGDPGNPFLQGCKTLLRRVLTFMLTPGDLEAVAEAVMYTVSSSASSSKGGDKKRGRGGDTDADLLLPGQIVRVYLVRLLEELIVDGVNEIVASAVPGDGKEQPVRPHAGGIANQTKSYLSTTVSRGRLPDGDYHPKHPQVQNFLKAFSRVLTPVWFASLLEGCHEQASASAVLRLMILMLQGSESFEDAFEDSGGFAPLVLSIPKFSICPGINMAMLSQLLHVPILHLPCFPTLDAEQLYEVFDSESEEPDEVINEDGSDPSCGIFALLAECLGRNIQLALAENEQGRKASETNKAVLQLLMNRHANSLSFQQFCCTPAFLEPLSQALCLIHDEKLQLQHRSSGPSKSSDRFEPNYSRNASRRGNLADVPKNVTPTERFIGRPEETGSTGVGMVEMIRLVVSHAVMSGPFAAPLVSALFKSFPIHASPEQVEAFHLVLIDLCKSVVEEALQHGDSIALANCIGVSSVLLDQLMAGFFTSEHVLEAVRMILSILQCITTTESFAASQLDASEQSMLNLDAAHMARLTCVAALRNSRPSGPEDVGDQDLQLAVLKQISSNIQFLMFSANIGQSSRSGRSSNNSSLRPQPGTKLFPIWQSSSLVRCAPPWKVCMYPDLAETDEPDRMFVVPLMVEINMLLLDSREVIRDESIAVVVALLQLRRGIMSEILIAEIRHGDRKETIDVMNRGGFSALLAAHEAASASGNVASGGSGKRKYAAFFEWLERNEAKVQLIFELVNTEAARLLPGLESGAATPQEAVENEQKLMLLKLTSQDSSDRTILGGLERAELAQRCYDKTAESHSYWKRQGFDDLASGAMQWKFLLRQLKGSCTIWEGGRSYEEITFSKWKQQYYTMLTKRSKHSRKLLEQSFLSGMAAPELIKRWKLDLSEGYERQRKRLLPNYEFHGLYNLDELADDDAPPGANQANEEAGKSTSLSMDSMFMSQADFFRGAEFEATADLLKEMNLKRATHKDDEDDYYDEADENQTEATVASSDGSSVATKEDGDPGATRQDGEPKPLIQNSQHAPPPADIQQGQGGEGDSSYELITGLLQAGDWPLKSYNVRRCTGLEVRQGLLLWCRDAVYIVDGFEQSGGDGLDGKITRLEKEQTTYNINLRSKDGKGTEFGTEIEASQKNKAKGEKTAADNPNEVTYQHRSQRIAFNELQSVYRRRYQLQPIALEFYDSNNFGTLIAFTNSAEKEEVLTKVLQSPLPNSIFSSSYGSYINYKKFMSTLKTKIVSQWTSGKISNFDFLMQLNSFAGRSYNDLTQYPVFPWIIADYESDEIDLNDPKTYRDLSKPMGGLNEERAQQFRERYDALSSCCFDENDPPPFHYGTHYSCAAYVLYYLMRMEPFSRMAVSLQGGRFDVADRLFHDVGKSWRSSSTENLQDVRELIPEFFYLPDFLSNTNNFDYGQTQKGKTVHDVSLPKWAKGDPKRFVRINRQALESEYVSKNLHQWIDLVFGYKQRGQEAIDALNTFVHVTYEGEVDLESMTDPVQRASTIAQIENFGQTPSRLFRKPFPQKQVYRSWRDRHIEFGNLSWLTPLAPPLTIVGASQRVALKVITKETCKLGVLEDSDRPVGDLCLQKGQLVGVGSMCRLNISAKKYVRFGAPNNGISVHVAAPSIRQRELNKIYSMHDGMHRAPICAARASLNGQWLVTGCIDSTVRVWYWKDLSVELRATLCGHEGSPVKCIDVSTEFGTIVTGCDHGRIILWDLRTLTFVRQLRFNIDDKKVDDRWTGSAAISVSINHRTGNIVALVGTDLCIFDVNGNRLASCGPFKDNRATCAISTDCPEWMEQGVVAVTGHENGEVKLWSMDFDEQELTPRHVLTDSPHQSAITALRVTGVDRQDTLLIGDRMGLMSVCRTVTLDTFSNEDLAVVVAELQSGMKQVQKPGEVMM
jgi:Beige/BEACH domain/PH domain associated with Beige/BEACH/WD domain, G-beta repeat